MDGLFFSFSKHFQPQIPFSPEWFETVKQSSGGGWGVGVGLGRRVDGGDVQSRLSADKKVEGLICGF